MSDREPTFAVGSGQTPSKGMSLRDYFAAAALTGSLADFRRTENLSSLPDEEFADLSAQWSYDLADAMLRAREGGQDDT